MESKLFKAIRKLWEPPETENLTEPKPEFQTRETPFPMPQPEDYDLYRLDPLAKRKMTICNLFVNHQKSIAEIVELLEVSRKMVIDTLIENRLIEDRRQKILAVKEDRRHK
ncbi:MAG TPA: hypothetical protein VMW38_09560 [Terriglobia bacterium]|nr:hypothetical protein [Terriglobia bacterium]